MIIINLMHWGEPFRTPLGHPRGQHWVDLVGNIGVSFGSNLGSNLTFYRWGNLRETLGATLG